MQPFHTAVGAKAGVIDAQVSSTVLSVGPAAFRSKLAELIEVVSPGPANRALEVCFHWVCGSAHRPDRAVMAGDGKKIKAGAVARNEGVAL